MMGRTHTGLQDLLVPTVVLGQAQGGLGGLFAAGGRMRFSIYLSFFLFCGVCCAFSMRCVVLLEGVSCCALCGIQVQYYRLCQAWY